jgi:serine/threonine-protein kinase
MIAVGSQLGPYKILASLGAGGMGEVFRARDVRLDREVAIKILPDQFAQDADRLARFEREAKAVAGLAHPNILVLFDFGTDQGICYAVMELLEGQNFRKRLAAGPLPWRQEVELGVAIAEGLAAAHAKGIIHRDLKPENLFLTADGRVKILDFGVARMEPRTLTGDETGPYQPVETDTGVVLGTVGYMSPEQLRGQHVDARSDIFSLGCVLYEMVAGARPFRAASTSEVQAAILRDTPSPLADAGQAVPAELERVIRRCLEKKPEERFPSARDLAGKLRALLTDVGSPRASAASVPTVPVVRRRRSRVGVAAGVLLVLAAGVWATIAALLHRANNRPVPDQSDKPSIEAVAILPFQYRESDPDAEVLGDGISEIIINSLSPLRNPKVRPFSAVARYKGEKNLDVKKVGEELKVQAVLTGHVERQRDQLAVSVALVDLRDNSQLWGNRYTQQFADVFAIQEDIARRISIKLRGQLTNEEEQRVAKRHTDNTEAFQFFLRGRHYLNTSSKEEGAKQAIASFRQALAKDPDYALAYAGIAEAYYWLSNIYKAPTEVIPEAKKAARAALRLDDQLGEAHAMMGLFLALYDWDWPAAEVEFRRAVELNPGSGVVHLYYGLCLNMTGRLADTIAELNRAKELDPSSPFLIAYASFAFYIAHEYDRAIPELEMLVEGNPKYYLAHAYLGLCFEQTREYDKAIAAFRRSTELDDNLEGKAQLGHVYAVARQREEALKVLEKLNELAKERYVSPYNIALLHLGLGDKDQAFDWLQKAAQDHSEWFAYLKVDPRLEPIRTDPRYLNLLRHLKLGPAVR